MEIKNLTEKDGKLILEVSGINEVHANTIRRSANSETPVMAIEEVEISKNDSALYDEILAHRLGLIPLVTSKTYNLKERCTCKGKGCAKCQLKLTLDTKGPKIVNSEELKSKDPEVKPVFDNIPIVQLRKEQEIKLIATAELGKGKDHVKFSPGIILYKNKPKITITKDEKILNKYKGLIPKKAFKNDKLDEEAILENNLYDAMESLSKELIKIEYMDDTFIFTIEPFGQLSPRDILKNAIKEFDYKLDDFAKKLKGTNKKTIKKILKK